MSKPPKPVKAFKHKEAKRAHIPSAEEAGYEAGNPKVNEAARIELPLNPVISRGQDPELFWMGKYSGDKKLTEQLGVLQDKLKAGDMSGARAALEILRDVLARRSERAEDESLSADIRSLYRHEHIAPETLIKALYRFVVQKAANQDELFSVNELFGNAIGHEELDKVSDYYTHSDGWTNRLIQGDSLLVMTSLLEREGMAGQVQCIYLDPPYGIKYGSNWQIRLNNRTVNDGDDESLSGEPEQIKAFRDTWELGIHSYLGYLRDRLLVARELLHESGSCFVQISDENIHLVRCLMDEAFGSENFVSLISFQTTSGFNTKTIATLGDFLLWYAKDKDRVKVRKLYKFQEPIPGDGNAKWVLLEDGTYRGVTAAERRKEVPLPEGSKLYSPGDFQSQGPSRLPQPFEYGGKVYEPKEDSHWKANYPVGMQRLAEAGRIHVAKNSIRYRRFHSDFPFQELGNIWTDTLTGSFTEEKPYVVYTNPKVIERAVLMTTDPSDLVLDPTCGSGGTALVSEKWGRRWITVDTSRIAINIAKIRLMSSAYPYYHLYDKEHCDLRQGFEYQKASHLKLENIANDEPMKEETLYDQPLEDKKRLRVAGPFTVETLQSYEPISPEELARQRTEDHSLANFEDLIFAHLKSAGVKTGDKRENAVFVRIDRLADAALHAEGWYPTSGGEKKAYLHIGPKFGTVSKQAVTAAIKACRDKRDGDWLLILGFAFESGITELSRNFGNFQVSIVRMHDDLLQQGLLKKDKKAASFVTIGEPDIRLHKNGGTATVEIAGLDIYDPIKDEVKSRDVHDIAYWMLDDDYDGSNFVARQVFFCGGDKNEFDDWKKGLSDLAKAATKKKAEQTLKLEIDDEAFARLYGHKSRPFPMKDGTRIAVRVVSQFGEETTKVLVVNPNADSPANKPK